MTLITHSCYTFVMVIHSCINQFLFTEHVGEGSGTASDNGDRSGFIDEISSSFHADERCAHYDHVTIFSRFGDVVGLFGRSQQADVG